MTSNPLSPEFSSNLRAAAIGLMFSILTILFGQGMGVAFGLNEDAIKNQLKADAKAVLETAYNNDQAAMNAVTSKSWTYMKRAHLHAGGMGTTAVALIVVLCMMGASRKVTMVTSLLLGVGGLGYSVFWMWAGFRAPGLGSTGAAKESLEWLAMPTSGGFVVASIVVLFLIIAWMLKGRGQEA